MDADCRVFFFSRNACLIVRTIIKPIPISRLFRPFYQIQLIFLVLFDIAIRMILKATSLERAPKFAFFLEVSRPITVQHILAPFT